MEPLAVYLLPKGSVPGIGPEKGRVVTNGIATFKDSFGSTRYVSYLQGKAISVLQVVSRDKKHAIIANVYTLPEYRRQGFAEKLLRKARQDFFQVVHAAENHLSPEGKAFRTSVRDPNKMANTKKRARRGLSRQRRDYVRHQGKKYQSGMDVTEIAKGIRKDIQHEVHNGRLPRAKYTVRTSRYSMGRSVDVKISDIKIPGAKTLRLFNEARLRWDKEHPYSPMPYPMTIYSKQALDFLNAVEGIVDAYKKSETESQSDYYNTNFHSSVEFDGAWRAKIREAQEQQLTRGPAVQRDKRAPVFRRDPASRGTSPQKSIKVWAGRGADVDSVWHNANKTIAIVKSVHTPPRFVVFTRPAKGMQFLRADDATTLAGAKKKAANLRRF